MIFTNLFKISDFEPVDLNERFVVNLYNRCLPTSTTTDYEPSTLIAKPNYFNVVDRLQFDKHKLKKEKKTRKKFKKLNFNLIILTSSNS